MDLPPRVLHDDTLELPVHAFEREVSAEPVLDLLGLGAAVQELNPRGELHLSGGLYAEECVAYECGGGFREMGRNPPQESAELPVRFERDCAIIHGVGFLFCELGACIIQYGFHRRKPTLLSGGAAFG